MTTALMISELLPLHDDQLSADIERMFDEIDRSIDPTPANDTFELLLIVDELVDEMLAPGAAEEALEISLELALEDRAHETANDEVAEVA